MRYNSSTFNESLITQQLCWEDKTVELVSKFQLQIGISVLKLLIQIVILFEQLITQFDAEGEYKTIE